LAGKSARTQQDQKQLSGTTGQGFPPHTIRKLENPGC
jgi:hypothetical protein